MDDDVLILGIGNDCVADDGAGIAACRYVRARMNDARVDIRESTTGGLDLLDLFSSARTAIVLDAIDDPSLTAGDIVCWRLGPKRPPIPRWSLHTMSLSDVLDFGRVLDLQIPKEVWLVGVQIEDAGTFGAPLSRNVYPGVVRAGEAALHIVRQIVSNLVMGSPVTEEQERYDRQRAYVP